MKSHIPLVMGNWKMNPQSTSLSTKLIMQLKKTLSKCDHAEVVVAPPVIYLDAVRRARNGSKHFLLGVQNVHTAQLGAHTGEISISMLKEFDVSHIIIGHSERRAEGETDTMVNAKLSAVVRSGLTGVVCVGENTRDQSGQYLSHVENQIRAALAKLSKAKLGQVVIAYEPIWAIGTGVNATPSDVYEMKLFIEKVLTELYGRNMAQKIRIIYGGSVNPKNARELFVEGMVAGFLVGGASLHADDFTQIVKATAA